MTSDELTLELATGTYAGWTEISVTPGMERCTRDFSIGLTERYPGQPAALIVQPGDSCNVRLGGDLVVTGYVNHFVPSIDRGNHRITVSGRGRCQDLVDCSAEWEGSQLGGMTALGIAQKLAQPYGITVSGETGLKIPQFNIIVTETPWDIIERITRYSQLVAYELADGSLTLSKLGVISASSGLVEGQNAQIASMDWSDDQRYSEYDAYLLSLDTNGDVFKSVPTATATDPNVKRRRILKTVAESGGGLSPQQVAQAFVNWNMNRRAGRSAVLSVTVDSWRDSAGQLWQPNTLVPVNFPSLKLRDQSLLLAQVTFLITEAGKTANLTLMPPQAFAPEPILLDPIGADLAQAIAGTP